MDLFLLDLRREHLDSCGKAPPQVPTHNPESRIQTQQGEVGRGRSTCGTGVVTQVSVKYLEHVHGDGAYMLVCARRRGSAHWALGKEGQYPTPTPRPGKGQTGPPPASQ